tara:strand:- start:4795 stop:5175 length:381 start_codon:yes stop_codon:yes gene_type:complete
MTSNEANIDIVRKGTTLNTVSIAMPVWDKPSNDGFISIDIPLFGIKTFAKNDDDANTAIEESIRLFCLSAEKFGRGLEFELVNMGWTITSDANGLTCLSFTIPETSTVIEQIMHTGDQFAKKLEIA